MNGGKTPNVNQLHSQAKFQGPKNDLKKFVSNTESRSVQALVGRKMADEAAYKLFAKPYAVLNNDEKIETMACLVGDDWWDTVKGWVS